MTATNNPGSLLATMVAPSDSMEPEFAAGPARMRFGIASDIERLTGERGKNFRLRAGARQYVLKVATQTLGMWNL
jgi:Ser/Thr protein kinase RdoA (MazF antagonist)